MSSLLAQLGGQAAIASYCSPLRAGFTGLGYPTAQHALLCCSLSLIATQGGKEREAGAGRQGFLEVEGERSEAGGSCSTTWPNRGSGTALFQL